MKQGNFLVQGRVYYVYRNDSRKAYEIKILGYSNENRTHIPVTVARVPVCDNSIVKIACSIERWFESFDSQRECLLQVKKKLNSPKNEWLRFRKYFGIEDKFDV